MREVLLSAIVLASACGDAPNMRVDGGGDAAVTDGASTDSSVDGFFPPAPINELNTAADERGATLANNGLAIYFTRTEDVGSFVVRVPYVARRNAITSQFNPPVRAAAFGNASIGDLEMSDDELEWFYWIALGQLATSTRADSDDGWSAPIGLGFDGFSPSISSDLTSLYYVSIDGTVLVRSRSSRNANWGTASVVPLALAENVTGVDISNDERELLVTTNFGVWRARRNATDEQFDALVRLFIGEYENARFGAGDQLISLIDANGPDRQIAIAARR